LISFQARGAADFRSMRTQPTSAAYMGPGSFPLSEELDFETWDLTLLASEDIPPEAINTSPKAAPGHHRATMLLDGISCSSSGSGSSTRSTPAGSFDGTSAQQPSPAAAGQTAAAGPQQAEADPLEASGSEPQPSTAAAGTILQVPANLSTSSNAIEPSSSSTPMQVLQLPAGPPADASTGRNAAGHAAAPSTLQLPDFSAFMLPEECAFAESSMDDALATPTPHTPVVPNMFAGEGLPVSAHTIRLPLLATTNLHGCMGLGSTLRSHHGCMGSIIVAWAGDEAEAPNRHVLFLCALINSARSNVE
jgi:hypothetical protein